MSLAEQCLDVIFDGGNVGGACIHSIDWADDANKVVASTCTILIHWPQTEVGGGHVEGGTEKC